MFKNGESNPIAKIYIIWLAGKFLWQQNPACFLPKQALLLQLRGGGQKRLQTSTDMKYPAYPAAYTTVFCGIMILFVIIIL